MGGRVPRLLGDRDTKRLATRFSLLVDAQRYIGQNYHSLLYNNSKF